MTDGQGTMFPGPSLFDQEAERRVTLGRIVEPEPRQLARVTDPDTSKQAAVKLSGKAETMRWRILRAYNLPGRSAIEMTADEATAVAQYSASDGAWKRVSDLLNAGLLEPTGETRPGRSGRQQRVLRITEAGREALGG